MDLRSYLKSLGSEEAREAFATSCETSVGHLRNVGGGKTCSPRLAMLVEQFSAGAVTRQDLLPESEWRVLWPELSGDPKPPALRAAEVGA